MTSSTFIKQHRIATTISFIILGLVVGFIYWIVTVDRLIQNEIKELSRQEKLLKLPASQSHFEKNVGCTWYEKQNWDHEGCYVGLQVIYDEQGPERNAEQLITNSLIKNGWQKRNSDLVWSSRATDMYGNDGSFLKTTPKGRFCAGISYRYFSDDMQNGPRTVSLYMLGYSDRGCSRW